MVRGRCNLQFKDNEEGNMAYTFLQRVKHKNKSTVVSSLIANYLKNYGVHSKEDINKLDDKQIEHIVYECINNNLISQDNQNEKLIDIIKSLVSSKEKSEVNRVIEESIVSEVKTSEDTSIKSENKNQQEIKETSLNLVHDYDEDIYEEESDEDDGINDDEVFAALNAFK